jgi:tRNA G46 methylase TrmB
MVPVENGAYGAMDSRLTNVRFLHSRTDQLAMVLKPHSLDAIWITFSDLFPKKQDSDNVRNEIFTQGFGGEFC